MTSCALSNFSKSELIIRINDLECELNNCKEQYDREIKEHKKDLDCLKQRITDLAYKPFGKYKIIEDDNRKEILLDRIDYYLELKKEIINKLSKLSVIYLFYDQFNNKDIKLESIEY